MRITTKEIAEICGVSLATVDRALHNRPDIKPKTREKILKTAKGLGYRPHLVARSLKQGKTMTLGVVVFDLDYRFFAQLVTAIEVRARELGFFVYLINTGADPEEEITALECLAGLNVDGIILVSVNGGLEFVQFLKSLHTPLVAIGNKISRTFSFIGIRDKQAIQDAVAYIAARNYQRIIYVTPTLSCKGRRAASRDRLTGYREGLKTVQLPHLPIVIKDQEYLTALEKISLTEGGKMAILCVGDIYALEILNYLEAKGLNVPGDVGLMGFDNIDMLKYVKPSLSTVAYPIKKIGIKAVDRLIAEINTHTPPHVELLDHTIIKGESI